MDSAERSRLKQLANDALIASFGSESVEQQLAEALEKCMEWIGETSEKCPTCSACEDHGDGEGIVINGDDIVVIHRTLAGIVSKLKDSSVGLLAENIASLEDGLDELESLTIR